MFGFKNYCQKYELGKVSKEELLEKKHGKDTSAVAAVIFKKATTTFSYREKKGFVSTTEFQIKLKVYKKEGASWANFEIPYYIGYNSLDDEQITDISAYTYNIENNQISKTKVESKGKFKNFINEYWAKKTIVFPSVKEGSIIELKYRFNSENLSILPEFQFQYDIPVDYFEFQTIIPEFFIYKGIKSGSRDIEIDQKIENGSQSFDNEYGHTMFMSYKQINTIYRAREISALKKEMYVANIDNYYGKIEHELETVRMPNEQPKQISTTWDDVVKSIYKDVGFGNEIKEYEYFLSDLKSITNDKTDYNERLDAIFNHVKNHVKWNGKYGYYVKEGVKKAYVNRIGNVAEVNFILLSMLKMGGFKAYPVLITTRENKVATFPNKSMFNYVIVAVVNDNKTILLDATDENSTFNILPIRCLNSVGRIIRDDSSSSEINLIPESNSSIFFNILASIDNEGKVSGKLRGLYNDYNSFYYRDGFGKLSTESIIEKLQKKYQGIEVSDYNVQNIKDLSNPIIENFTFISDNEVEIIGDKMYFSPFLFLAEKQNPFKQEIREYPVDFVFPNTQKFTISITIPDGYLIENLPTNVSMALPENIGKFSNKLNSIGNQIQLIYSLDINQAQIAPIHYESLKSFFRELINKHTEKIVLKKV